MTATGTVQPSRRPSPSGRRLQLSEQQAPSAKCHDLEDMQGHGVDEEDVMANAGSTATTRREQSDARGRASVRHEPFREQTCKSRRRMPDMASSRRAGSTALSESAGSPIACAGMACSDGGDCTHVNDRNKCSLCFKLFWLDKVVALTWTD